MAFIVKRDAVVIPAGIPVASTTNVIVTFGDTSSLNYARDGYPTFTSYFVDNPIEAISFQRLSFDLDIPNGWSLVQYSSGEEGDVVIWATNPSTNPLIIPTTGWIYTLGTGPAITITAFPSVYIDSALYLKYDSPYFPASIGFSAGNANIYYVNISNPGEEYPQHNWLVFSSIAGDAGGGIGSSINLEANKWYILSGGCGDGGCSIYIVSVNTSANQTSANIPLQNWPNGATITF
jgi:hypothetical protein